MLDGGSFMKAGWVHGLKLYKFSVAGRAAGERFVAMAMVYLFSYLMHYHGKDKLHNC